MKLQAGAAAGSKRPLPKMEKGETRTVMQAELPEITRAARKAIGATQEEVAERLSVARPNISKAENDPSGRYLSLQRRIIEDLAGWKLRGPLWEVERPENP